MRRFLIAYNYATPRGSGFGSLYLTKEDGLPTSQDLAEIRQNVVGDLPHGAQVIILAVSEVSAPGPVVA